MTPTVKKGIITALLLGSTSLGLVSTTTMAADGVQQQGNVLELAADAPERHVVVKGDTLWDIAALFLKSPWRWPEIWQLNQQQIKDPHWIYPGQVVWLDRSGDQPRLRIGEPLAAGGQRLAPRVYAEDNAQAIASIAPRLIEPFLSQPLVVEADALDSAPRIVATQEDRVIVGVGNVAYVNELEDAKARWQVYRPGRALIDPQTRTVLGHEAFYLGDARVTQPGRPATIEITRSVQEIGRGDRLVMAARPQLVNYVPHAPNQPIKAQVMSIYGALAEAATHSIVTLSRGAKDGLEVGHVLALSRAGSQVDERYKGEKLHYQLPEERYGLLFVFRTFDRVAYALVMNVTRPVKIGDSVVNP